jgi:hypothetical protein
MIVSDTQASRGGRPESVAPPMRTVSAAPARLDRVPQLRHRPEAAKGLSPLKAVDPARGPGHHGGRTNGVAGVAEKASHEETGELRARLSAVAESLGVLRFVPGTAAERRWAAVLERAGRLARSKLLAELTRGFTAPVVAVVAGGTNVGKSSLFNALLGEAVSSVDARAGHTALPVAAGGGDARAMLAALLPEYVVADAGPGPEGAAGAAERDAPALVLRETATPGGVLLLDSPDVDSALLAHHGRAEDALLASDILVFVTSPTKYNDKQCVEFLLRAAEMGKSVAVLFNFLPGKTPAGGRGDRGPRHEILDDFRRSVLGRLPKGTQAPGVFEFDALAADETADAGRAKKLAKAAREARAFLEGEGARASRVKRAVASGGARHLASSLKPALRALREEARSLESVRATLESAARRAEADYERFLRAQEFIELELVLGRLMARFRVPVLDEVLDVLAFLPRKLAGAILRRATVEERRAERARSVRAKETELLTRTRVDFARSLEECGSDEVAGILYREIVTPGYFSSDLGAAWAAGADARAAVLDAWLGGFEGELVSRIERSPGLRKTLKAFKAVLELGSGVAAAMLTGGISVADLVWAPTATKATQMVLERLGREYFHGKRDEYITLARSTFSDGLDEVLLARLRDRIPASPAADDVDAVERELLWLARSFPATVTRAAEAGGAGEKGGPG